MKVLYAEANFGADEIKAATQVLEESHLSLMGGTACTKVEKEVANLFSKRFGVMTGSSANLSIQSLELPKGSKVITPALTFQQR